MNKKLEQFRLARDVSDSLQRYSEASGMGKTEIVELALRRQMAKGVSETLESRLNAVLALNDAANCPSSDKDSPDKSHQAAQIVQQGEREAAAYKLKLRHRKGSKGGKSSAPE